MNDKLRLHIQRQLGLPAGQQLDLQTNRIFHFYQRMRDEPRVKPDDILQEPGGASCHPVVLKFARALDRNRDAHEGNAIGIPARLLGRKLGKERYQILYRLGVGGMGEVYAASRVRASNKEDLVAVKTLRPILPSGEKMDAPRIDMMVRRIQQEAANLDQVANYEHVLKFIEDGYDSTAGLIYIVTEFIDGRSLNELALQKFQAPLPPSEVLWLIREACKGLVAIHHAPAPVTVSNTGSSYDMVVPGASGVLLHRDVKPSNILFDRGARVKLIDLGLAGPAGATSLTGGTPGFSDPDQFAAGIDLDERADVYALGKTFYSLLCRDPKPPLFELPDSNDPVWNGRPPEYVALIRRATARDREERYRNAAEFLAALDALGPVPAPDECSSRLRRLLAGEDREINIWVGQDLAPPLDRSRRKALVAAGVVATVLLGGTLVPLFNRPPQLAVEDKREPQQQPSQSPPELERLIFYLRRDANDQDTHQWDVTGPNSKITMYIRPERDDLKLIGHFDRDVRWSILWHDTNDKWSCPIRSDGSRKEVLYPLGEAKVIIPRTDPPGTHVLYLVAGPVLESGLESILKKPPETGPPPEVLGQHTGDMRGPTTVSGRAIRTADDYLSVVNEWLPKALSTVKYLSIVVKDE